MGGHGMGQGGGEEEAGMGGHGRTVLGTLAEAVRVNAPLLADHLPLLFLQLTPHCFLNPQHFIYTIYYLRS